MVGNVEAPKTSAEAATQVITDTTPPITTAIPSPTANAAGWNNTNVMIGLNSTDSEPGGTGVKQIQWSLSGAQSGSSTVPGNTTAVTISNEGTTTLTYFGTDNAGNIEMAKSLTVKIDKTKPTFNPIVSPNPVLLNGAATIASGAADALSGLASQSCGAPATNSVGTKSVTCTATDNAGNTNSQTVTYKVIYRFDGFLQPINDTAHSQTCGSPCPVSIFKGGSTVPVKFQLKDANGIVVQSASLPLWTTPMQGGATSASIDESTFSDPAMGGATYFWVNPQYIYTWSTKGFASGYFWRIGVTLDDGQTYFVYIGLT